MASERLSQAWDSLRESLNDQQWFQELRGKWEELDPQQRNVIGLAAFTAVVLLIAFGVGSLIFKVRGIRNEYHEKSELLLTIQSANDEMRRLRESGGDAPSTEEGAPNWTAFFDATAGQAGVDKATMTVSEEKPGGTSEMAKEHLFDIQLKKVNIKQAVRFAYHLENGSRPAKLRNLSIDASNPEGWIDATLSVSTFSLEPANK